jgi:hypothetical protein
MKTICTTLLFSLLGFFMIAQPTITSSWLPDEGDLSQSVAADRMTLEPGSAGMNQTWDFSDVIPIDTIPVITFVYFDAASSVYASAFPNANIALAPLGMTEDSTFVSFYNKGVSEVNLVGNAGAGALIQYTDAIKVIETPFTMGNSFTDTYASTTNVAGAGLVSYSFGTETITGDGAGTLITPTGTFNNVLRLKSENHRIDSTNLSGIVTIIDQTITSYLWLSPSVPGLPLASLTISSGESRTQIPPLPPIITPIPESRSFAYAGDAISAVEEISSESIEVYVNPNPVRNQALISWEASTAENVKIYVRDITGKVLYNSQLQQEYGNNQLEISMHDYVNGIYLIEIVGESGRFNKKIMKQ